MAKVIFQTGMSKTKKISQNIKVFINDEESDKTDNDDGFYLTAITDYKLRGFLWYMHSYDLEEGDQIRVEVETWIPGAGKEENLTFEALYSVLGSSPVEEISNPKVGMKGYPIIKGRIVELYCITEDDKRKQNIEDCLSEGF